MTNHSEASTIVVMAEGPCAKLLVKWLRAARLPVMLCEKPDELAVLAPRLIVLQRNADLPSAGDVVHCGDAAVVEVEIDLKGGVPTSEPWFSLPRELGRLILHLRAQQNGSLEEMELLFCGSYVIDPVGRVVCTGFGEVELTAVQFDLLLQLATNPGVVVSSGDLQSRLGRLQTGRRDPSVVRYHVARLRARLGKAGRAIENVRGCGYRMNEFADE